MRKKGANIVQRISVGRTETAESGEQEVKDGMNHHMVTFHEQGHLLHLALQLRGAQFQKGAIRQTRQKAALQQAQRALLCRSQFDHQGHRRLVKPDGQRLF